MKSSLLTLNKAFIENRDIVKSAFPWESTYYYPICGAIFMEKRRRANPEQLKYCAEQLKQRTGVFSNFRGAARLPLIAKLCAEGDSAGKLSKAIKVHDALKEYFGSSQFLPVASAIIADTVAPSKYDEISKRTRNIYDLMRKEHPFLTSGEDSVFAAMLALSEQSESEIVKEMETCYQMLKPKFFSANAVQSLSHVLALSEGNADYKCRRTAELFDGLKARGCRYGTEYELPTLGVLAMLPGETDEIIQDIIDVDGFLAKQKGYGFFGLTSRQRLMHAGMIVASEYVNDDKAMAAAAVGGTMALIAAQQAAMCTAIAAAAASNS